MLDEKAKTNLIAEPERYELLEAPAYHFELDRRDFFKLLGADMVVISLPKVAWSLQESGGRRRFFGEPLPTAINAWLHIGENGIVTAYTGKVEIGQNIRTSLSQAVAEELHFEIGKIKMIMGDTQLTPFDMGTFGSRTTPTMNLQLRKVAAAARETLTKLAADRWKVDAQRLVASDGKIVDSKTKRSVTYAELVKGRQLTQTVSEEDPPVPASQWSVEGKPFTKIDARDFVTGRHRYPADHTRPGLLHGKILRPPSFGATLKSLDTHAAEQMSGVTLVHDGNFVGAAAPSQEMASRAIAAIHAQWQEIPQPSSKEIFQYLKANPIAERTQPYEVGSVDQALSSADRRLEGTYTVAYIAHAPLEPRAAVAEWFGDRLTVWTGTQRPFGVRGELAEAFRMPEDHVRVLMPDMGSGYGGKHTGECAIEAARLARAAPRPVKVLWTRGEEFTWAYFRPAGVIEIKSGMSREGRITAWEFHNYNSGGAAIRTFYDIPNQRIEFHPTRSPLRQGSYRGLAATANHFARESFMDELAHQVKMDPLEFRLKNLKDDRLRAVFEAAAKKFGWGREKSSPERGFGMGGGFEKGSNVATCVEVHIDRSTGQVKIVRAVTAFECGAIVNPDGLQNQVEGALVMGIGGALFEAIQFENGRILNPLFSEYRVPRFSDVPQIEVVLLDRKDIPSAGAGETPIVGLAPAVGNAIFNATGVRLRSLPMVPHGLKI